MAYVPAITKPVIVPRGQTVSRQLSVHNGTSQATVTGSYVLYSRTGSSVASGSVTSGTVSVAVPSDLELGVGAYEEWSLSSPLTATIRQPVAVSRSLDSRFNLVSTIQLTGWRSWLAIGYPAGRSDWEVECEIGTAETLRMLVGSTELSSSTAMDLWDAGPLAIPAATMALAVIHRSAYGLTGAQHFADEAARLEADFAEWWQRAPLAFGDATGVGPDTLPASPGSAGFPRPGPAGMR